MSFKGLLTQKCDIYRSTKSTSSAGFVSGTFPDVPTYANVSCRLHNYLLTDSVYVQTETGESEGNKFLGFFNGDVDIEEGDRVIWQNKNLTVIGVNPIFGSGSNIHHLEVMFKLEET